MKTMKGIFLVFALLLQSTSAIAATSQTIKFENQTNERFSLENNIVEEYEEEIEVDGTCTRKVPYQENVCRDVTKYKTECRDEPSRQECRQVNDPICSTRTVYEQECERGPSRYECRDVPDRDCSYETRYEQECSRGRDRQECTTEYEQDCDTVPGEQDCRVVTRYREECSGSSGGQECRTIPGDIQCEIVNGENRCRKIPPRQECSDRPSSRECRQVPYEERECRNGTPRRECRTVPRQSCRTVPGEYECRQVPKQERVCHDTTKRECGNVPGEMECRQVPRQKTECEDNYETKCETIPAQRVCEQVPYTERVCGMETKYREEEYACKKKKKVKKERIVKGVKADVDLKLSALTKVENFNFELGLTKEGDFTIVYPEEKVAILYKEELKKEESKDLDFITANYELNFIPTEFFKYPNTSLFSGVLSSSDFSFTLLGKVYLPNFKMLLQIKDEDQKDLFNGELSQKNLIFKYDEVNKVTKVSIDYKSLGVKLKKGVFKKHQYYFKIVTAQDFKNFGKLAPKSVPRDEALEWSAAGWFRVQ